MIEIEVHIFNLIEGTYEEPTSNNIYNSERLGISPLRSGARQGCLSSLLLSSIVVEVLTNAIRQDKEIKDM